MAYYNIKSVDPTTTTINCAAISTILAVIVSIIALIYIGVVGGTSTLAQFGIIICSFIFGTIIVSVYHFFAKTILYNFLSKKLGTVQIDLFENKEIKNVSVKTTSIVLSVINTILFIIYILIAVFFLQVLFNIIYSLIVMFTGNMILAYVAYQIVMLLTDPLFVLGFIFAYLIFSLIKYLISTYLYNGLTGKIYGVLLKLRKEDDMTVIDSINPVNTGLIFGVIQLILGIIMGIISLITAFNLVNFVIIVVSSFIGAFVLVTIVCFLYNKLSSRLGKIKVELTEV